MLPTRDPLQGRGHTQTESEGMEKDFMQTEMKRKQGLQYSDKIDFKTMAIKKDKKGHYILSS